MLTAARNHVERVVRADRSVVTAFESTAEDFAAMTIDEFGRDRDGKSGSCSSPRTGELLLSIGWRKKNRAMHNDERVLIDSRQHVESDSGHARQWPTVAAVISMRFNRKRRVISINYYNCYSYNYYYS